MPTPKLTDEQFIVLLKLSRGDFNAPSTIAARMVLVDGATNQAVKAVTGVSKENLYDAVGRWEEKGRLIREAYGPEGSKSDQFDLLVKLCRGDSNANSTVAARMVLVDGVTNQAVKAATGISKQSLYSAVKRWEEKDRWIRAAYLDGK
ncbi:TPA: hypothetical protein QDZ84_003482 [Shewanella algae]|uniref:hypothetical protein n=1 Tax=Shewanella TaxID=22 RepID=UPI0014316046|nr:MULTISPECIES: hypothetical protein [Shewanella]NJI86949.1 hypothetical protein [Shewanella sp. Iso12]HDS1208443.1 hypothetical protein [Shewanella algae]